jgi:RNA polymerase sigma-70 factor (ECF subfamily)
MADQAEATGQLSRQALDRLLEGRRQFLAFIRSRVESPEAAEDILQEAFVRGIEKGGALRDEETAVAWFYRVLRNAIIDHYRQRGSLERTTEALFHELEIQVEPEVASKSDICGCVSALLETLKPEYRDALRIIDLEERRLADLAGHAGITSNNAAVRVHRAREALLKQVTVACGICATHGCLDCYCKAQRGSDS